MSALSPGRAGTSLVAAGFAMVVLLGATTRPVHAQVWNEVGDAGDVPWTAQLMCGPGTVTEIDGSLSSASDVDMYAISTTNPALFSASLQCVGNNGPNLWVFDTATNKGVAAASLCQTGVKGVSSALLPPGSFSYWLAVSYDGVDPFAGADAIWLPGNAAQHVPDGPGAAGIISGWQGTGQVQPINPYRIVLTGAIFPCDALPAIRSTWGGLKAGYR